MPLQGIDEWDKQDGPFHDNEGLAQFASAIKTSLQEHVDFIELDCHINDQLFTDTALGILDNWVSDGTITL